MNSPTEKPQGFEPRPGSGPTRPEPRERSDLFLFDSTALQDDILSRNPSRLEYREYAVFNLSNGSSEQDHSHDICHKLVKDESSGPKYFNLAIRDGYGLDEKGEFKPVTAQSKQYLEGRVRHVICRRNVKSEDGRRDGLLLSPADFAAMNLHPGTLQYIRRTTTESISWNRSHNRLSLILAFSPKPRPAFDFLSMTYSIPDRTATVFIRQSFNAAKHRLNDLPEYQQRMQACRRHWAHPLVTAVVLLQVQFTLTEVALADTQAEVYHLEQDVSGMVGFAAFDPRLQMRAQSTGMSSSSVGGSFNRSASVGGKMYVGKTTTQLMKHAHDALRRTIRLLETVRWMERAVRILMQAGDELGDLLGAEGGAAAVPVAYSSSPTISPIPTKILQPSEGFMRRQVATDPMSTHWHEIRQYLEGLLQLCKSLDTDRTMLEVRCKAQIDMIYSKMAQEDNHLNARMAVASTRDSSSMKALAVITAIFLPGEFIASLFGMSMFEWLDLEDDDKPNLDGPENNPVVTSRFWIYWAIVIPLSAMILSGWRAWWVIQDREFRRHLSPELSDQKCWTGDGRPRDLETSFWHDFFYLSVRREAKQTTSSLERKNTLSLVLTPSQASSIDGGRYDGPRSPIMVQRSGFGMTLAPPSPALRHIAFSESREER